MTTQPTLPGIGKELAAAALAAHAMSVEGMREALEGAANANVRIAVASVEQALSVLEWLADTEPAPEFPIQPEDEPTTVEAVRSESVRRATRVIALRHAFTDLRRAAGV